MNWLTLEKAGKASLLREDLLKAIFEHHCKGPGWQFAGTKPYVHEISPGCDLCGNGDWSCLFINGICNAQCFYCPSAQKEKGQPMTSSVEFSNPHEYEFSQVRLKVSYSTTFLKSSVSYRHAFKEVSLGKKKKVAIERTLKQPGLWFEGEQIHQFGREFVPAESASSINITGSLPLELLNDIKQYEVYNSGLVEYY